MFPHKHRELTLANDYSKNWRCIQRLGDTPFVAG
jgi:hypothetical protein